MYLAFGFASLDQRHAPSAVIPQHLQPIGIRLEPGLFLLRHRQRLPDFRVVQTRQRLTAPPLPGET
jgi:hypothetical protein